MHIRTLLLTKGVSFPQPNFYYIIPIVENVSAGIAISSLDRHIPIRSITRGPFPFNCRSIEMCSRDFLSVISCHILKEFGQLNDMQRLSRFSISFAHLFCLFQIRPVAKQRYVSQVGRPYALRD